MKNEQYGRRLERSCSKSRNLVQTEEGGISGALTINIMVHMNVKNMSPIFSRVTLPFC